MRKIRASLEEIKKDFREGFYNQVYVLTLHNILNSGYIKLDDEIVVNSIGKVELYTKSTTSALKLLEKEIYKKSSMERSNLLTMNLNEKYFTEWYSNEESVLSFIKIIGKYIEGELWENTPVEIDLVDAVEERFQDINLEILDSLLYRYLLWDLVSILTFYVERQHER